MKEITNARTVAFMKARNFLVVPCKRKCVYQLKKKKKKNGGNLIFKAYAYKFWLTSKSCSWFNKVGHAQPSKGTSWKGNDMSLKVD